jgi:hypothetical protein
MYKRYTSHFLLVAILSVTTCSIALAQSIPDMQPINPDNFTTQLSTPQGSDKIDLDHDLGKDRNWYFSFGLSKQQYAPSDIHVSQPGQNSDFTVYQARGSDYSGTPSEVFNSLIRLGITDPQENIRIGKFMDEDKTFAIEFSLDHTKYNTNVGQTAHVRGTINGQARDENIELNDQTFDYALHNGLNHLMLNAVWLRHLSGPRQRPGNWQLISRVGAGILLPHADNTIFGNKNEVGPKNTNICCTSSKDWWQINGWTAGVEVGLRYRVSIPIYIEMTAKVAYGELRNVPVYQGTADQNLWMLEEVLSVGYLF